MRKYISPPTIKSLISNRASKLISITFGVLVLCFVIGFYVLAWTEPSLPPTGGNIAAPINVGQVPQKRFYEIFSGGEKNKAGQLGLSIPGTQDLDKNYVLTAGTQITANAGLKGIKVAGDSWFEYGTTTFNGLSIFNNNVIISPGYSLSLGGETKSTWSEIAGVSYWKLSGSNLYTSSTAWNVGIGTTSPLELLSLGTAGTTKGVLSLAGNTSGKIIIQPAANAGTYTLTLPTTQGAASTNLQNDGTGNLSWAAAVGGVPSGASILTVTSTPPSGYTYTGSYFSSTAEGTNAWVTKTPMLTPRGGLAAASPGNGKIYAIGGYNSGGGITTTNEEYDPVANTWATKASMPTARHSLAAASPGNGKIYAIGGGDGKNEEYTTSAIYFIHQKN